jgi:hypothetical protein
MVVDSFFVRSLVLVCSLPLTLPSGWCCMISLRLFTPTRSAGAPMVRTCCGHCKHAQTPKTPSPKPLPPGKCPCTDRNLTVQDSLRDVGVELTSLLPAAIIDLSFFHAPLEKVSPNTFPFLSISLQPLHCTWLC